MNWEDHLAADLRESNDILDDVSALRARLADDGYLLIRELRPRSAVLDIRRQILTSLEQKGELALGTDPMDGKSSGPARATKRRAYVGRTISAGRRRSNASSACRR